MVSWLPVRAALARLTYAHDHFLVQQHLEQPPTTPLILVRHAKAMDRKDWSRKDTARPINSRGRRQAQLLVPMLAAYGVARLVSSTSTRCLNTLLPYAHRQELPIESYAQLSEEVGADDAKGVAKLIPPDPGQHPGDRSADRDLRTPAGAAAHPGGPGDGPGHPGHRRAPGRPPDRRRRGARDRAPAPPGLRRSAATPDLLTKFRGLQTCPGVRATRRARTCYARATRACPRSPRVTAQPHGRRAATAADGEVIDHHGPRAAGRPA